MVCSVCGSVLGNIILSEFLASVDSGSSADPCMYVNISTNHSLPSNTTSEAVFHLETAFLAAGGTVVGIMLICGVIVILGTTEKKDILIGRSSGGNVWRSMKSVLSFRPYYIALPAFLIPILTLQASDVLYMPVWQKTSTKIGKMRAFVLGLLLFIPILVSLFFLPANNVIVAFIFCHLVGAALGCIHLLPWTILPDVIDDYIVRTKLRNDALFYSFFQSFMKISNGVGLGMSTLVLGFTGYETGACQQPDSVGLTMRILVSAVPICLILISLIFLWLFPITEARSDENSDILARRRAYRERHRSSSVYAL